MKKWHKNLMPFKSFSVNSFVFATGCNKNTKLNLDCRENNKSPVLIFPVCVLGRIRLGHLTDDIVTTG